MHAIIETGGKQYKVAEGDVLSKASIETGREALPFGGDYIPFADGRVDPAWVQAHMRIPP